MFQLELKEENANAARVWDFPTSYREKWVIMGLQARNITMITYIICNTDAWDKSTYMT